MATFQIPPSNHVLPGSHLLPHISFPEPVKESALPPDPKRVVDEWASSFSNLLRSGGNNAATLFHEESYWRDLLCLTWDFHTFHGPKKITELLASRSPKRRIKSIQVDNSSDFRTPKLATLDYLGNIKCIQSFVRVETDVGKGGGLVRLLLSDDGIWKCYTLFTVLQELEGHEGLVHARRPVATDHVPQAGRQNWLDERVKEENFEGLEPAVLIIGK